MSQGQNPRPKLKDLVSRSKTKKQGSRDKDQESTPKTQEPLLKDQELWAKLRNQE